MPGVGFKIIATQLLRAGAIMVLVALMIPRETSAQTVPGIEIQGQNDGLDFWLPKIQRPDGEYTNGLRVSLTRSVAPLWGRLVRSMAPCTGTEGTGRRCLTTEFALAQQMYTPLNAYNEPRPITCRIHGIRPRELAKGPPPSASGFTVVCARPGLRTIKHWIAAGHATERATPSNEYPG